MHLYLPTIHIYNYGSVVLMGKKLFLTLLATAIVFNLSSRIGKMRLHNFVYAFSSSYVYTFCLLITGNYYTLERRPGAFGEKCSECSDTCLKWLSITCIGDISIFVTFSSLTASCVRFVEMNLLITFFFLFFSFFI